MDAHRKEREYIEKLGANLNIKQPSRTKREWFLEHKEARRDKQKQWEAMHYERNKERISEKAKVKFICSCGVSCRITDRARHEKSKQHQQY